LIEGSQGSYRKIFFNVPKKNEDDFADARVDERCLCLALKY
jgi:hypothetical protein